MNLRRKVCIMFAAVAALSVSQLAAQSPTPSGMLMWLYGDAGVITDIGGVSVWQDQSGNAINGTQSAPGDRPSVVPGGLNGHDTLAFDGTGQHLNVTQQVFPVFGTGMHAFLVTRNDDAATGSVWIGDNADIFRFMVDRVNSNGIRGAQPSGEASNSGSTLQFHISEYSFDGIATYASVRNGVPGSTATGGAYSFDNIAFYSADYPVWHGDGEIAEIIVYDELLSPDEANRTGSYLAQKYSISAPNYDYEFVACTTCEGYLEQALSSVCTVTAATSLADWKQQVISAIEAIVPDTVCPDAPPGNGGETACEAYLQSVVLTSAMCELGAILLGD